MNATGDYFLTISGGIRLEADPSGGPRLFLYRQTYQNNVLDWTYLGPIIAPSATSAFSEWSGNFGINFETSGITRLNEYGMAYDDESDPRALNIIGLGTEQGRNGSHENHWPLCKSRSRCWVPSHVNEFHFDFISILGGAVTYHNSNTGSVESTFDAVGVVDWGRVYASIFFPVSGNRSVLIGWTYVDNLPKSVIINSR